MNTFVQSMVSGLLTGSLYAMITEEYRTRRRVEHTALHSRVIPLHCQSRTSDRDGGLPYHQIKICDYASPSFRDRRTHSACHRLWNGDPDHHWTLLFSCP